MSDKLIIDVIGVIKMSMQSITRLVGIGSKSEDLHGARMTRWRTSSAVTQLRFCRTFLVSGGLIDHLLRKCPAETDIGVFTDGILYVITHFKTMAEKANPLPE